VNPSGAFQFTPLLVSRGDRRLAGRIYPAGGKLAFKQELELDASAVSVVPEHRVNGVPLLADPPEAFSRTTH
jgi:hypothetical protein